MAFCCLNGNYNYISDKEIAGNSMQEASSTFRVWKDYLPIRPFDYNLSDDRIKAYDGQKQGQLQCLLRGWLYYSLPACLDATFTPCRHQGWGTKVLGASVPSILACFEKIVLLIVVANLFACLSPGSSCPSAWQFCLTL